ncbi:MAG: leucine-rich repeat domain-containing protein [bacterium]|nr:leucine-rich repeat domain-containing protein [bacterium]
MIKKIIERLFGNIPGVETNPFKDVLYKNRYADTPVAPMDYPKCICFDEYYSRLARFDDVESDEEYDRLEKIPFVWNESILHMEEQSQTQRAWDIACEIFETAAKKGVKELSLGKIMDWQDYKALNTLPESIGELKDLKTLILYGSNISSIPREISGCKKLKSFDPYTSYRLHWLPYEITHCGKLIDSCISTRALYGNFKMRPPFPDLSATQWKWHTGGVYCSVCGSETESPDQYWISRGVATDVVPLLVTVCSKECLGRVGKSARNYVQGPHKGGREFIQPSVED